MNKKICLLTFVSLVLVLAVLIQSSMAYFYAFTNAKGKVTVTLFDDSEIIESKVTVNMKNLVITNTGTDPIFVRAKAVYPSDCTVTLSDESASAGWVVKEEWCEYGTKLEKQESIEIKFNVVLPENAPDGAEYNIVLLYEATPALNNGSQWYADWTRIISPGDAIIEEGD